MVWPGRFAVGQATVAAGDPQSSSGSRNRTVLLPTVLRAIGHRMECRMYIVWDFVARSGYSPEGPKQAHTRRRSNES